MAIGVNTVWEVRPSTGSDSNGGAFDAAKSVANGGTGVDYSTQNSAQATGTVTSVTTTVTATTAIFTAAMVGNLITDGTTWKEITAYTSSTIVTVDSAPSWTAASIKVGGALATLKKALAIVVQGNAIFCKAEATQQINAGLTASTGGIATISIPPNRLIGYTTTRGDGGQFTLQLITNTGLTGLTISTNCWSVRNITVDCNSLGTSTGIAVTGLYNDLGNCKAKNFTTAGITLDTDTILDQSEITGGTSAASAAVSNSSDVAGQITGCWIHDNACPGIAGASVVVGNLITNNTGTASDGIVAYHPTTIINNTIYGSGRHGINATLFNASGLFFNVRITNNIIANSGASATGYGLYASSAGAGMPASSKWDGNAYYGNTNGNRHNCDDTGSTNPINGVTGILYSDPLDVYLTVDPFTNDSGGNFTLNNTTGGGASLRGFGVPTSYPAATGTSSPTFGAFTAALAAAGGVNRAALPSGVSALG